MRGIPLPSVQVGRQGELGSESSHQIRLQTSRRFTAEDRGEKPGVQFMFRPAFGKTLSTECGLAWVRTQLRACKELFFLFRLFSAINRSRSVIN